MARLTASALTAAALAGFALAAPAMAERGSDGQLNLLFWRGPSTLNPYMSGGEMDMLAASLILEPLAAIDPDGFIVPKLAASIPSRENGGLAPDMTAITWTLKPGLRWSDGSPVTAADVKFTADYCLDAGDACAAADHFAGIRSVEIVDPLTVTITFKAPRANPFDSFVGSHGPILQAAQFGTCSSSAVLDCRDESIAPIGTGPFRVIEFSMNQLVRYEANPEYREPDKPAFATVRLERAATPAEAARAVLVTGSSDYAPQIRLAPETLDPLLALGKGRLELAFGRTVELIAVNLTDPSPDLPEAERATLQHPHPILTDRNVRLALSKAIDRDALNRIGYGETGKPGCSLIDTVAAGATDCLGQDIPGARALLDQAGWLTGADGIREKDGRRLSLQVMVADRSLPRQFLARIGSWWREIGVETIPKIADESLVFNPAVQTDSFGAFRADLALVANGQDEVDPAGLLAGYSCATIPRPETRWSGSNLPRFCDAAYEAMLGDLSRTSDADARAALVRRMDLMLTRDRMVLLPLIAQGEVSARSDSLSGVRMNPWDSEFWNIADWSRKTR